MRCLVIEDDADTAQYICTGLGEAGYIAECARTGSDGLRRAVDEAWDVVVLDRMLPGDVEGLKIVETMRALGKATPILVLSALAGLDERVRGLHSGGDDYLTKPFALSELVARIQALLRRAERAGKPIALQPREFRLLEYLVRNQGQVVTRAMLLEAVWDYHFDPQTNVVDVQISRLRQKIDKDFDPPLLRTIRGTGYTMSADD